MESILTSVKLYLGIVEEYEHFDRQIIEHINSVFADLNQLGLGPEEGFRIEDKTSTWGEFIPLDNAKFDSVKSYMDLRVRLLFDPPAASAVLASMERQIEKFEWRLNVVAESD